MDKIRIGCGSIFKNKIQPNETFARIDWYFTNQDIFRSIDNMCNGCNLANVGYILETGHSYEFRYGDDKIMFIDTTEDYTFETEQPLEECFICFIDLFEPLKK
jgi:hypothetical protein